MVGCAQNNYLEIFPNSPLGPAEGGAAGGSAVCDGNAGCNISQAEWEYIVRAATPGAAQCGPPSLPPTLPQQPGVVAGPCGGAVWRGRTGLGAMPAMLPSKQAGECVSWSGVDYEQSVTRVGLGGAA